MSALPTGRARSAAVIPSAPACRIAGHPVLGGLHHGQERAAEPTSRKAIGGGGTGAAHEALGPGSAPVGLVLPRLGVPLAQAAEPLRDVIIERVAARTDNPVRLGLH